MTEDEVVQYLRFMCAVIVQRGEGAWVEPTIPEPVIGRRVYQCATLDAGHISVGSAGLELDALGGRVQFPYSELTVRPPTLKEMLAVTMGKPGVLRLVSDGKDYRAEVPSQVFGVLLNALYKVAAIAPSGPLGS